MPSSNLRSHRWWTHFWLGVALLAAGLLIQLVHEPTAATGLLRIRVLDIGQGDSILIDTPGNQHILIDGGPDDTVMTRLGQYLVAPKVFRLVVPTHNDEDHVSGLISVLGHFPITQVWISGAVHTTQTYSRLLQAIRDSHALVKTVHAGETLDLDHVEFKVLFPLTDMTGVRPESQHDATVVVKTSYGQTSLLLTGDLDEPQEATLVEHERADLAATVLKVSHHGSKHGSTDPFLDAVHPQAALISVGAHNRFGHPTEEALGRLAAHHIQTYRTDQQGTLTVTSDGLSIHVQAERSP